MRPPGSARLLEARRRRALAMVRQGVSVKAAARGLGCAPSSVMRWLQADHRQGESSLKVRSAPGRPRLLTAREEGRLMRDLLGGALAHGYRRDRWTSQRIVEVIVRKCGVRYSRAHISRLLARNGWDARAHARQAGVRDEAARERWNRAVRRVRGKRLR